MATRTYTTLDEPRIERPDMVRNPGGDEGGTSKVGMSSDPWESGGSHHKGSTAAHSGTDTAYIYMQRDGVLNEGPPSTAHDPEVLMMHLLA